MKFLVRAKNFMRFRELEFPLHGQGLVLVLGENRDVSNTSSNGAGKSSLAEAFCWAIWGKTIRGITDDEVVNEEAGKDCYVTVSWESNGHTYEVTRYRKMQDRKKPNDLEFKVDGVLQDAASMASTTKLVESVLGISFDTFRVLMPGMGIKVAELTDSKVKQLLEQLLQLDEVSRAHQKAKDSLKHALEQVLLLQEDQRRIEKAIQAIEVNLDKLATQRESFDTTKTEELNEADQEIANLQKQIEELSVEIGKKAQLEESRSALESEILRFNKVVESIRVEKEKDRSIILDLIKSLEMERASICNSLNSLRAQKSKLKDLTGGVCPECLQDVDDSHTHTLLSRLEDQESSLDDEVKLLDASIEGAKGTLRDSDERYETTLKELKVELRKAEDTRTKLKECLTSVRVAENTIAGLEKQLDSWVRKKERIQSSDFPFEQAMQDLSEEGARYAAEWAMVSSKLKDASKEAKVCKFWVDGFSAAGIRSLLLQHVTPVLNSRAAYYSKLLTKGSMKVTFSTARLLKSGKSKEEFNISVEFAGGSKSYKAASSGEKSRADLVIALALSDLAQMRSRKSLPFRFLDEPFEHIDSAGHEAVVALLSDQQSQYDTVYCITHNQSLQQHFQNSVTVVKESGVSRLERTDV